MGLLGKNRSVAPDLADMLGLERLDRRRRLTIKAWRRVKSQLDESVNRGWTRSPGDGTGATVGEDESDLWDPANCSGLEEVEVPVTVPLDLLRPDKSMEAFPVLVEHCGARQVLVGLVLHDILEIDEMRGSVSMDLSIRLRWVDPCFRNYEGSNAEVEETCWKPQAWVLNARADADGCTEGATYTVVDRKRGVVQSFRRFITELKNPQGYVNFPFDSDLLRVSKGSRVFTDSEVVFTIEKQCEMQRVPRTLLSSLSDWKIYPDAVSFSAEGLRFTAQGLVKTSECHMLIVIHRHSAYYLFKITAIQSLLYISNASVFFISSDDLASRLSVTVTLLLASLTHSLVSQADVPRIGYTTTMDRYFFVNISVMTASIVACIISYKARTALQNAAPTTGSQHAQVDLPFVVDMGFLILYLAVWIFLLLSMGIRAKRTETAVLGLRMQALMEEIRLRGVVSSKGIGTSPTLRLIDQMVNTRDSR